MEYAHLPGRDGTGSPAGRRRPPPHPALTLQRTFGNRGTQAILARSPTETAQKTATVTLGERAPIEILSWSTESPQGSPGGGAMNDHPVDSIRIQSLVGGHSPELQRDSVMGTHFDKVVIKSASSTITLHDVVISYYGVGDSSDGRPTESWTLNFFGMDAGPDSPPPGKPDR